MSIRTNKKLGPKKFNNFFSAEDEDDKDSSANSSEDNNSSDEKSPKKSSKPVKHKDPRPPEIVLSPKASKLLETLMLEGDLLEVTLDETQHIWRILQATEPRRSRKYPGRFFISVIVYPMSTMTLLRSTSSPSARSMMLFRYANP